MTKYIGLLCFIFCITDVFPCELNGHFDFNVSNDGEILYSGCYDANNKGPHIIEYILTKKRAESTGIRRPSARFTQNRDGGLLRDLVSENGYSLPSHGDYTNSGYDRGHMAPNADFNDTAKNAVLTFFIGNIWPQTPEVNKAAWLAAENETRRLAGEYLVVKVIIIVDEFTGERVKDIQVPSVFKRRVYDISSDELIYTIDVFQ